MYSESQLYELWTMHFGLKITCNPCLKTIHNRPCIWRNIQIYIWEKIVVWIENLWGVIFPSSSSYHAAEYRGHCYGRGLQSTMQEEEDNVLGGTKKTCQMGRWNSKYCWKEYMFIINGIRNLSSTRTEPAWKGIGSNPACNGKLRLRPPAAVDW